MEHLRKPVRWQEEAHLTNAGTRWWEDPRHSHEEPFSPRGAGGWQLGMAAGDMVPSNQSLGSQTTAVLMGILSSGAEGGIIVVLS